MCCLQSQRSLVPGAASTWVVSRGLALVCSDPQMGQSHCSQTQKAWQQVLILPLPSCETDPVILVHSKCTPLLPALLMGCKH